MQEKRTLYLAGKIMGDPYYFTKFYNAQKKLEEGGFIVVNPALLPAEGFTWEAYMRMSGAMLAECAEVCFLPDWKESKTTVTGNAAKLTVTEAGFDFDGCADDTAIIERMRKGRCIYAKTGAGAKRTDRIQRDCEGERPCKAHLHDHEQHGALPEEIPLHACKQDTG